MYYFKENEETKRVTELITPNNPEEFEKTHPDFRKVEIYPEIPLTEKGYRPCLYFKNDKLVWEIEKLPDPPKEEKNKMKRPRLTK